VREREIKKNNLIELFISYHRIGSSLDASSKKIILFKLKVKAKYSLRLCAIRFFDRFARKATMKEVKLKLTEGGREIGKLFLRFRA
jgi:hypothetical protein